MTTKEEQVTMRFLNYLYENYSDARHIKRMAPSIGPVIWKLYQVAPLSLNRIRQIKFDYEGHRFKGRYSHHGGGRLEVVEAIGRRDGRRLFVIKNLTEAMELDVQEKLNEFLAH